MIFRYEVYVDDSLKERVRKEIGSTFTIEDTASGFSFSDGRDTGRLVFGDNFIRASGNRSVIPTAFAHVAEAVFEFRKNFGEYFRQHGGFCR